jgi:SAM-dependent methyltransferase
MWLPRFQCECGGIFSTQPSAVFSCPACGARLEQEGGVFRCLPPARLAEAEPFLAQYRVVRQRDGYRADRAEYYRSLPDVEAGDPQRHIWRIRQRSFQRLMRVLRSRKATPPPAVLDLGAGSGWLSYRLTKAGCRPVAVDLLLDDLDGLGARGHYDVAFPCVQADFDALPFVPAQFDVVVFNGSLHYAPDVASTLCRASRMLAPRGTFVVVDSPLFEQESAGHSMRARNRERLRTEYGVVLPIEPGEGFLTFARMTACAATLGMSPRFFPSYGGLRQRLGWMASRLADPDPAHFGVWVAA